MMHLSKNRSRVAKVCCCTLFPEDGSSVFDTFMHAATKLNGINPFKCTSYITYKPKAEYHSSETSTPIHQDEEDSICREKRKTHEEGNNLNQL
jgi:hypothetical protein